MFRTIDYDLYRNLFSSREEYENYCRCVNKISVGDLVHVYTDVRGRTFSSVSETAIIRPVVGLIKRNRILLGSSVAGNSFWIDRQDFEILEYKVEDFNKYKYFWWLNSISDGRIAKIELNKNTKYDDLPRLTQDSYW